ncbi:insulinase family protein [Gilvimarinus polysaccharolyticus]|uniref:insulinase family protein n=1 Tax=Gilvimarinus polysaccharolyticus TaxID=863921 RepID=UPI000673BF9C|nr:insulinase family protein [Gilvimarinus polysaccharolyticus]
MRKPFLPWAISLFCLILVACESSPHQEEKPPLASEIISSPNDSREYRAVTLANNLEVLLISDITIESGGASLSIGVGSYQNPKEIPGLAHYLEHMLFLGTKKYPEPNGFQRFVEQNAGSSNAYTATDHTNYFFQVSAEVLPEALDRFSDYFKAPIFDRQYSDKERNAVNSEWSMGKSQDGRIINRIRGITANPSHPSSAMPTGNLETLADQKDISLYDAMLDFYKNNYSANIMKLVIFGKEDLDSLEALANKNFASLPNHNIQRPQVTITGLTPETQGMHIYYKPQKPLRRLNIEFPIDNNQKDWRVKPNDYIANLISSEEPGTVAQILREKGWVDDFTAGANPGFYGEDGFFTIQIGVTQEGLKHQDNIITAVFSYLDLVRKKGIDPVYHQEYRAMLEKQFNDMQMPAPLSQATYYSVALFDYPEKNIINAPYLYEKFDADAIKKVLKKMVPERARIWHINPEVKVDKDIPWYEGKFATKKFSNKELVAWRNIESSYNFSLPEENDLFSSIKSSVASFEYAKPHQVLSTKKIQQQGIEAWLTHSQYHQSELGYLQVMFNSDLPIKSAKNWVSSDLVNRLFALQTTPLRDKAGRAGIGIGIERPKDNHALTLSGYSEKHLVLYRRLLNQWINLEVNEKNLNIAKDGFKQWIESKSKQEPYRQLFAKLDDLVKTPSFSDDVLLAAIDNLTIEDINNYQKQLLSKNRIRIFAFGNYTNQQVEAIADETWQALSDKRVVMERYIQPYSAPVVAAKLLHQEQISQTDNALLKAWYSPDPSLEVGARLALLNAVFHNAFYTQLRTEEQLGYVVGSSFDRLGNYWGFVIYAQSSNTNIATLKDRFDRYLIEYKPELDVLDNTMLEQLRTAVIAQINQPPANFNQEYPRFLNDFYRGNDHYDSRDKLLKAISDVSKADIIALYQSLILEAKAETVQVELEGAAK